MKILFVCGGTGGHIAPAIAIAEHVTNHECIFITSHKLVDKAFIKKYKDFQFYQASAEPFTIHPCKIVKFLKSQLDLYKFAKTFIRAHKIDLVFTFGGFISVGFGVAAHALKIPLIIHDSNIIPGKATRLLQFFAKKIILPIGCKSKFFKNKTYHLAYPIRKEFNEISSQAARQQLRINESKKVILVVGGSNGSEALTNWAEQNYTNFENLNVCIYCIAGPKLSIEQILNYKDVELHIVPFCNNMNCAFHAADIVISRSGAGSIGEAMYCTCPMILVPYPFAADNHQLFNAKFVQEQGIAKIIEQKNLDTLYNNVKSLLTDENKLSEIKNIYANLPKNNAAECIAKSLNEYVNIWKE